MAYQLLKKELSMIKDTVDDIRTRVQGMKERATSANEHLVLDEVLQQIAYASGEEHLDDKLITAAECAWFQAAARYALSTLPPFVPVRGNSKWLLEEDYLALCSFFLKYGPEWTTGHGALEAIDHLVECSLANANFDAWDTGMVVQAMRRGRVVVRGKRHLTGTP